jgi:histidyl-tRNA synthetase
MPELIMLSARLLRTLGLERIELHVNSLGTPASRRAIAKSWSSTSRRTSRAWTPTACAASTAIHCAFSTARIPSCRT